MRYSLLDIIKSFILSCLLLVILEIFSSTVLPLVGLKSLRLSFNILIILFLALRIDSRLVPYCILLLQIVHSVFSIEGWAIGTIAGVMIAASIKYLKDIIDMNSKLSTMVVVQVFQVVWIIIVSFLFGFKMGNYGIMLNIIKDFIPQSFLLSIFSPYIFLVLDKIWATDRTSHQAGVSI